MEDFELFYKHFNEFLKAFGQKGSEIKEQILRVLFKSELRNEMTYDELELDAVLLEVLENRGSFDSMDDEELYELIEQVAQYTDGDYEEAFEYMTQFSPIPKKRFVSLFMV